jgi:hypothetical protein
MKEENKIIELNFKNKAPQDLQQKYSKDNNHKKCKNYKKMHKNEKRNLIEITK